MLVFLLLALMASAGAQAPATLVVRNGDIWTGDARKPAAQAVAARGANIVYVGDDAGAAPLIGPSTRVIDLEGRFVVPGFTDTHVHFEATGRLLYGLNLLDVSTEGEGDLPHSARAGQDDGAYRGCAGCLYGQRSLLVVRRGSEGIDHSGQAGGHGCPVRESAEDPGGVY
ncbi:MAG: amidohydrolase family protein [Acidimicrobiia bacterium]|nr:amidohydrolase family protein [Acidimicrobiia bacterium]